MRHVRPAAAALAAQRRNAGPDKVDRAVGCGEIVGYRRRDTGLAVVDRDDHRDARTKALLGLIEQAAQVLGIEPIQHLPGELHAVHHLVGGIGLGAAATQREGLARLGQFRLELAAFVEQCGDPATGLPIGATRDNLKAAVAGETHEYTDMYPGMAKTARDEGHDEIADWFETLAKAERSHANRYAKALAELVD